MRTTLLSVAAAFSLAASALSAHAAPLTPAASMPSKAFVNIAGGCGYNWHPTLWGECVPNRYRLHRVRPYTEEYIEEWDEYDSY